MKPKSVAVVVQARLSSQRVPKKMIRPIGGSTLVEILLDKLLKSSAIRADSVYLSFCESELLEIGSKYPFNIFRRSLASALEDNELALIYEWHDKLPFDYVFLINACAPFLSISTIDRVYSEFVFGSRDGLFGVLEVRDYFWDINCRLVGGWPTGQKIMNTKTANSLYKAGHILYGSKLSLISDGRFMGNLERPEDVEFCLLDDFEAFDIDNEWQFKLAEAYLRGSLKIPQPELNGQNQR